MNFQKFAIMSGFVNQVTNMYKITHGHFCIINIIMCTGYLVFF